MESKKFLQVLEILKNSQSDVLSNLAEINMSGVDVLAYTYQGVEIKIGNNDEIKSRMHNLSDIMLNITENNIDVNTIEYIDVRFDSVPTIKFKE